MELFLLIITIFILFVIYSLNKQNDNDGNNRGFLPGNDNFGGNREDDNPFNMIKNILKKIFEIMGMFLKEVIKITMLNLFLNGLVIIVFKIRPFM